MADRSLKEQAPVWKSLEHNQRHHSPLITVLFPYDALLLWKVHSLPLCHSSKGISSVGTYQKYLSDVWYFIFSTDRSYCPQETFVDG